MDRMMESLRDSTPQTLDGSAIHMVKVMGLAKVENLIRLLSATSTYPRVMYWAFIWKMAQG